MRPAGIWQVIRVPFGSCAHSGGSLSCVPWRYVGTSMVSTAGTRVVDGPRLTTSNAWVRNSPGLCAAWPLPTTSVLFGLPGFPGQSGANGRAFGSWQSGFGRPTSESVLFVSSGSRLRPVARTLLTRSVPSPA